MPKKQRNTGSRITFLFYVVSIIALVMTQVYDTDIKAASAEKEQLRIEIAELGNTITSLQQQVDKAESVISDIEAENATLSGELDSLDNENQYLLNTVTGLKKKVTIAEQARKVAEMSATKAAATPVAAVATTTAKASGKTLTVKATAYIAMCSEGCTGITATGTDIRKSTPKIIAVDPKIIPLGTTVEMFVDGKSWGYYKADDTGGAIKGHKIDVLMPTYKAARNFGKRTVKLTIVKGSAS